MEERIAIIEGARTPFCKANGVFRDIEADDLAAYAVAEAIARSGVKPDEVDELIFGNVMTPPDVGNIARAIAIKGGLPIKTPAFTVNRNCASGMEAITSAALRIAQGEAEIIVAGGVESMSHFPIYFPDEMRSYLMTLSKAKSIWQKLAALFRFRPRFLKPRLPLIGDPLCGLSMGQTAEILAKEFKVTRAEQDEFSFNSQQRAANALKTGHFKDEIVPVPLPKKYNKIQVDDDGIRPDQTLAQLEKLRPVFDKINGSVTPGTSSQLTDGACALVLMKESKARQMGLRPLGYVTAFASAGVDPSRMGIGPYFAAAKLFKQTGLTLEDFDLIEINEAFAAQVLSVVKAFASAEYAKENLGQNKSLGIIDLDKLNVNGGAISLGHPLGASGARLVYTLIKELNRRGLNRGLAMLCVGGGQGEAIVLEVE